MCWYFEYLIKIDDISKSKLSMKKLHKQYFQEYIFLVCIGRNARFVIRRFSPNVVFPFNACTFIPIAADTDILLFIYY